jgi:hypothetical protein
LKGRQLFLTDIVSVAALSLLSICSLSAFSAPPQKVIFRSYVGTSILEHYGEADLVAQGTVSNGGAQNDKGTKTDQQSVNGFVIKDIIKGDALLKGQKQLFFSDRIEVRKSDPHDYFLFASLEDGTAYPRWGIAYKSRADAETIRTYIRQSVQLSKAKSATRLAFYFQHLGDENKELAADACLMFWNAPYIDLVESSVHFDAGKLSTLLNNKDLPKEQRGLFGLLLGLCRRPQCDTALQKIVESADDEALVPSMHFWIDGRLGLTGVIAGYCLSDPEAGSAYLLQTIGDSKKSLGVRGSAIGAARFLLAEVTENYPEILLKRMNDVPQYRAAAPEITDILRRSEAWGQLDKLSELFKRPSFRGEETELAIIKFALKCPGRRAKDFIREIKQVRPQAVTEAEEKLMEEESWLKKPGCP